jgi:uncharacterized damage-inducible protein DinB
MSAHVAVASLVAYSDHERQKWREWIAADPARMRLPFQTGARFADVAALLDHVFLIERRHLCRLQGATPPSSTGVPSSDWMALFEYGDLVRADFRAYVDGLDEATAGQTMVITGLQSSPDVVMTRRRLVTHVLVHEIRHLAQLAYAARLAGLQPPGEHDIFYFEGLS